MGSASLSSGLTPRSLGPPNTLTFPCVAGRCAFSSSPVPPSLAGADEGASALEIDSTSDGTLEAALEAGCAAIRSLPSILSAGPFGAGAFLVLLSFGAVYYIYAIWFISVWCFFAALLSAVVYLHFVLRKSEHNGPSSSLESVAFGREKVPANPRPDQKAAT